jgi:hypothetical protein
MTTLRSGRCGDETCLRCWLVAVGTQRVTPLSGLELCKDDGTVAINYPVVARNEFIYSEDIKAEESLLRPSLGAENV